ncbi:hypothetical protein [Staphylococcus chromogenes]|uniref:hypothetical protein n=1 Tax=Staphylococcus chromogenes TaxID=46126 RepID=UPI0028889408|nr:hypothetical protein [Staphylococcus chromogenes]MDT0739587.1 hypothetical protein [Staphylococcus chromogenes]
MKQIYAFETKEEYEKYQSTIERFNKVLDEYQHILKRDYDLVDLPKGILWTSEELATTVFLYG